jgi:hypothetical protein
MITVCSIGTSTLHCNNISLICDEICRPQGNRVLIRLLMQLYLNMHLETRMAWKVTEAEGCAPLVGEDPNGLPLGGVLRATGRPQRSATGGCIACYGETPTVCRWGVYCVLRGDPNGLPLGGVLRATGRPQRSAAGGCIACHGRVAPVRHST